jgi:soluble lytic murein transglycosylase-like protein
MRIPTISVRRRWLSLLALAAVTLAVATGDAAAARTAERVTLTNGFDLLCDHREQAGDRVRLYTAPGNANFVEVAATEVASIETVTLPAPPEIPHSNAAPAPANPLTSTSVTELTRAELREMLSSAGTRHNLDVNLLAALVHVESGGHTRAVSKAGARGLMQLMPRTAAELGVSDSFRPEENISAGTAYLDTLLTRYHDQLALALAAYNAGPAAVDRYHGVPPYRETRLYVARIIREFNASVKTQQRAAGNDLASANPPPISKTGAN